MSSDAEELTTYLQSMPSDYRAAFDLDAARAHAAIVHRRGDRPILVEAWRELSNRVVAICVVADDKPGLLSCISAALVAHRIDVVAANAYCRTRNDGGVEAVDILWIRRLPGAKNSPIRARHIAALADAIERAVRRRADGSELSIVPPPASETDLSQTGESAAADPSPESERSDGQRNSGVTSSARIRFDTNDDGGTVLTVEAVDRPGLLLAVTQALFRAGFQIIGLRATTEAGCAVDRFTLVQANGAPLRQSHLLELQPSLLAALDEGAFAVRGVGEAG